MDITMETRAERAVRFAEIWHKSRKDAGRSQEYMALSLGVSKKTIQNWERGLSSPDLFQPCEWFYTVHQNPMGYWLDFLYPELSGGDTDTGVQERLIAAIRSFPERANRQLLFLMGGKHGCMWQELLQMLTAYCHLGEEARACVCNLVNLSYEIEFGHGSLNCADSTLPDLDLLQQSAQRSCVEALAI